MTPRESPRCQMCDRTDRAHLEGGSCSNSPTKHAPPVADAPRCNGSCHYAEAMKAGRDALAALIAEALHAITCSRVLARLLDKDAPCDCFKAKALAVKP